MRRTHRRDGVNLAGLNLFAAPTLLMGLSKLMGLHDWSWWRVCLPIVVYVAFNVAYIGVGFIYLSRANIEDRASEDEAALLDEHAKTPYFWLAWVNIALFALGATERMAPSEALNGFWLAFGNLGVMLAFGSLAVVNLYLYWSRHRQLAERAPKHHRRRTTTANNLTERHVLTAC
jgi:hypothetical protein